MPRVKDKRKRRKWEVSSVSIAEATRKSSPVVRRDINAGKCVPWDLVKLSQYVLLHALKKGVVKPEAPVSIPSVRLPEHVEPKPPSTTTVAGPAVPVQETTPKPKIKKGVYL